MLPSGNNQITSTKETTHARDIHDLTSSSLPPGGGSVEHGDANSDDSSMWSIIFSRLHEGNLHTHHPTPSDTRSGQLRSVQAMPILDLLTSTSWRVDIHSSTQLTTFFGMKRLKLRRLSLETPPENTQQKTRTSLLLTLSLNP